MADKSFMADKKAALPGLPAPEEDEVIDFESSILSEDPYSNREPDDRFAAHYAQNDEDGGKSLKTSHLLKPH